MGQSFRSKWSEYWLRMSADTQLWREWDSSGISLIV